MTLPMTGRPSSCGRRCTSLSVLVNICLSIVVAAVVSQASTASAQSVRPPVYTIRAGDTLNIEVAGHAEWSLTVIVRPDGRVTHPATGEIAVAGATVAELTELLTYALGPGGRHLRDPNVFINVAGMRTPVAYLLGAVARAGAVELPTGVTTAPKLLTMSGGPVSLADLGRVTIYRANGGRDLIDLAAQLEGEAEPTVIRSGDVLVVPEIETLYVGVLGVTGRTGEVPLPPRQQSIDMLELLVKIGGVGQGADPERALILRADGAIDSFRVDQVLAREVAPPRVYAGDVLWVPPAPPEPQAQYFAVTGAVRAAGRFEHREGMTLGDALALSGELSEAARPEGVTIIHADGEKTVIDVRPMLSGEDTEIARIAIQPDDIILVPAHHLSYVMLGAIGRPGFFPWDEGTRLADALARAGGLSQDAAAQRVVLVRRAEDGGSPTVLQIDARKLLQGENEAANWTLMAGDTVYVPAREPERGIRDVLSEPLSILGVIGALERVFNW